MAAIFAIDLSAKLNKVVYGFGMFKLSKNIKQKLYILYFTLVAFPTIDHTAYPWLRLALKELHDSIQIYIRNTLIENFSFNNQFHSTQYFIKSNNFESSDFHTKSQQNT
ncbi:hypothetical protein RF11_00799 [Thelohanellus kitauei]|uniref:Uncharacterized protein n=1 Tax=Thelohanellus kitauei TaxID=669202 RepID=A0A0C2NC54_THEKT|nr:hypothetical protein RF11_00799 [Thelohanellus kitauei]